MHEHDLSRRRKAWKGIAGSKCSDMAPYAFTRSVQSISFPHDRSNSKRSVVEGVPKHFFKIGYTFSILLLVPVAFSFLSLSLSLSLTINAICYSPNPGLHHITAPYCALNAIICPLSAELNLSISLCGMASNCLIRSSCPGGNCGCGWCCCWG